MTWHELAAPERRQSEHEHDAANSSGAAMSYPRATRPCVLRLDEEHGLVLERAPADHLERSGTSSRVAIRPGPRSEL